VSLLFRLSKASRSTGHQYMIGAWLWGQESQLTMAARNKERHKVIGIHIFDLHRVVQLVHGFS